MKTLPEKVFDVNPGHNHFNTVSEAIAQFPAVGVYDAHNWTSWADTERDLTAWRGNAMQNNALDECYRVEGLVKDFVKKSVGDKTKSEQAAHVLADWRKLTTSDHFYYMCTKFWADGDVHKYFSPYDSPYDAYINYMNVMDNVKTRIRG